jgi:hypothetical protein
MRILLALLITAAWAQDQTAPPAKPDGQAAPAKTDEQAKSVAPAADQTINTPVPAGEPWFSGDVELGYRWVTMAGNVPTYRSVVNLGEGPKLIHLDFTVVDPQHRLFDRLDARASDWGGDPYNTAHLEASKRGWYRLSADYRNIIYFNAMPSYANPFAPNGFNQQAFDIHKRLAFVHLEFFPEKHFKPYLAFERNANYGHGTETWVQQGTNEFPVASLLRNSTNSYRAGVHLDFKLFHVTLEQGGTTFKDDDQASFSGTNYGNRTTPVLGTTEVLNTLQQAYGVRGSSLYSTFAATATPFSWITLYGQYLWSEPRTDARYFDIVTGNFVMISTLLIYGGQFDIAASNADAPHVLANAGFEIRPFRRLRIIDSYITNRYHDAAFGALTEQFLVTPTTGPALVSALNTRQVVNDNQEQIEAIFEITPKVTLRGGYRYVWGNATVRGGELDPAGPLRMQDLRRNVGIAGATLRPWQRLLLNFDYEGASTSQAYFRTSLYDYNRLRARAKYQATGSLWFQANFALLDNQNPSPAIHYDFQARDNSLAIFWTPNNGKRISVMAEYDRSSLHSSINYLLLPFLTPAVSLYRENGHTATSAVDINLPGFSKLTPKLTMGGSLFISAGTSPTEYYQPLARLSLPFNPHLQWNTEWQWYGFGEQYYQYEAFRAHTFLTGLRVSR